MRALVQRWGHTGFGLATSPAWALPMAVWAGGADLSGTGEGPWIAFRVGVAALVLWLALMAWASRVPLPRRARRLEPRQMSGTERGAWLGFAAAFTVAVGWLNAAATVDWRLLAEPLRRGRPGAWLLVATLAAVLALAFAGGWASWRRARREWLSRRV